MPTAVELEQEVLRAKAAVQDAARRHQDALVQLAIVPELAEAAADKHEAVEAARAEFDKLYLEALRDAQSTRQTDGGLTKLTSRFGEIVGKSASQAPDPTEPDAASRLREANRHLNRIRQGLIEGAVSKVRAEVDASRAAEAMAQAALAEAELKLIRTNAQKHRSPETIAIERLASQRGITKLVHFTRIENAPSIIQQGLLTRADIRRDSQSKIAVNDRRRLDRRLDFSSLSISRINHRVHWDFTKRFPDANWCILTFDVSLLWSQKCLFCATNAARSGAVAEAERAGWSAAGLEALFVDPARTSRGEILRSQLVQGGLPENETTDPQAEVLVHGTVPWHFIRSVTVATRSSYWEIRSAVQGTDIDVEVDEDAFKRRADYRKW